MTRIRRVRTPERTALLRAEWPAGVAARGILERFNALPGDTVDVGRMGVEASKQKLHRPAGFNPLTAPMTLGEALAQAKARDQRPKPVPQPEAERLQEILYEPVATPYEAVAAWAQAQGIVCTWWDDLRRVNAAREALRLPPYKRAFPQRRFAGARG